MKKTFATLATAALVALGIAAVPLSASAASGNVTGLITDTSSVGINDATLEFKQGGSTYYYYTDSNGQIEDSTTLPVGTWSVFIYADGYAPEYYDNSYTLAGATLVTVANVGDPVVINAQLALGSTIEGTISGPGGVPVPAAQVFVWSENSPERQPVWKGTDVNGYYAIDSLAPGVYQVQVVTSDSDDLVDEWYDNAYSRDDAAPVQIVTVSSTVTVNVQLAEGGTIAGTVTNSIGSPVTLPRIYASGELGGGNNEFPDSNGEYSLPGLLPDPNYTVSAIDYSDFFEDVTKTGVAATAGNATTTNFVVTPTLVDESEFTNAITPISGPTTVEAGKTYTWKVDVGANSDVYAILYSSPVYLGAAKQDLDGTATITLTIPTTTTPGVHKLTFSSYDLEMLYDSRDYFDITVTAAKLPNMGVDLTVPLGGGALLLLAGAGLWVAARRLRVVR